MASHIAQAEWIGDFRSGKGVMNPASAAFSVEFTLASVLGDGPGTNPIEILATALAGCFSSTLAGALAAAGHGPRRIQAEAHAHLEKTGPSYEITSIDLNVVAVVPGLDSNVLQNNAERVLKGCPIGRALSAVPIALKITLA